MNISRNKQDDFAVQSYRRSLNAIEKGLFRNPKRINSVIKFNNVLRVISKNINQLNKNRILELLTIETKFLKKAKIFIAKI